MLDWDTTGAEHSVPNHGWRLPNDLGYMVELTEGYVTTYSAELVPCRDTREPGAATPVPVAPQAGNSGGAAILRAALRMAEFAGAQFAPSEALAGHSAGARNPAAFGVARIESLTTAATTDHGMREVAGGEFCNVHYLVAKAPHESLDVPATTPMIGSSLYLRGKATPPDGGAAEAFEFRSTLANAALQPLEQDGTEEADSRLLLAEESPATVRVVIIRKLGTLFDGIEFGAMSERAASRRILSNLIDGVEFRIDRISR